MAKSCLEGNVISEEVDPKAVCLRGRDGDDHLAVGAACLGRVVDSEHSARCRATLR